MPLRSHRSESWSLASDSSRSDLYEPCADPTSLLAESSESSVPECCSSSELLEPLLVSSDEEEYCPSAAVRKFTPIVMGVGFSLMLGCFSCALLIEFRRVDRLMAYMT